MAATPQPLVRQRSEAEEAALTVSGQGLQAAVVVAPDIPVVVMEAGWRYRATPWHISAPAMAMRAASTQAEEMKLPVAVAQAGADRCPLASSGALTVDRE
jgi:hypothetical protein